MKKVSTFIFTVLSALMLLCALSSCSFTAKNDSTFNVSSFPYKSKGYDIVILTYSGEDFVESIPIGTVSNEFTPVTRKIRIKSIVDRLYVSLVYYGEVRYYVYINKMSPKYDVNGYWMHNKETTSSLGAMICGISEDYFEPLSLGENYNKTFESNPFFLYHMENVKGKTFKIDVSNSSNAALFVTDDKMHFLEERLGSCTVISRDSNSSQYFLTADEDDLYFCVCPKNYKTYFEDEETFINFSVSDISTGVDNWCFIEKSFITPDGQIFLTRDTKKSYIEKNGTNILFSYNPNGPKLEKLYEFSDPIEDIQGNDNYLYISSGKSVYKYDIKTKIINEFITLDHRIRMFHLADNKGFFLISDESTYGDFYIYEMSPKTKLAERKSIYNGDKFVHIPEQNTLYFQRTSVTPSDIEYLAWNDTWNITHKDSPYHGDYPFYGLLERYSTQNKLITANGDIFNIEDSDTKDSFEHITNIFGKDPYKIEHILFDADYFYAVVSSENKIWLEKRSIADPETVITKTPEMNSKKANNLSFIGDKIMLLANDKNKIATSSYEIYCFTFDKNLSQVK